MVENVAFKATDYRKKLKLILIASLRDNCCYLGHFYYGPYVCVFVVCVCYVHQLRLYYICAFSCMFLHLTYIMYISCQKFPKT